MDYLFDIIMVAVLALSIFIGYKRGLVITVLSLASVVVALVIAQICSPYVSEALEKTGLRDSIAQSTSSQIELLYEEHVEDGIQKSCKEIIDDMKLPGAVSDFLASKVEGIDETDAFSENVEKISYSMASFVITILSYVLIALAVAIILIAVIAAVKLARLIPAVKKLDNAGGALLGAVLGIAIVYVVCLLVYTGSLVWSNSFAEGVMSDSLIIALIDKIGAFSIVL